MADTTPPDFWTTLLNSGVKAATSVAAPLTTGLTSGFNNLVQAGVDKTSAISTTIAKTTDPNKGSATSQPATPPTTTNPPSVLPAAFNSPSFGTSTATIMILLGLVALFFFMRKK